jgi:hypothetical protein
MAPDIDDRAACAYDVLNVFLSSNADRATYSLQALRSLFIVYGITQ